MFLNFFGLVVLKDAKYSNYMLKSHMLTLNFVCRLCALEKKVFVENGDMPETVLEMKAKVEELKQKLEVIDYCLISIGYIMLLF